MTVAVAVAAAVVVVVMVDADEVSKQSEDLMGLDMQIESISGEIN